MASTERTRTWGAPEFLSAWSASGFGRGWFGIGQEAPGFAVFFVASYGFAVWSGIEREAGARGEGFDWDDVPDTERDDVGYEEVDLVGSVGDVALGGPVGVDDAAAIVGVMAEASGGGFDLDAPEMLAGIDDEVIALAVANGFVDSETELRGLEGESDFG